jgi:hypothetical protein
MPSNSDDSNNNTPTSTFTLSLCPTNAFSFTFTAFIMSKVVKKKYTTGARIKTIYMLNKKQP